MKYDPPTCTLAIVGLLLIQTTGCSQDKVAENGMLLIDGHPRLTIGLY